MPKADWYNSFDVIGLRVAWRVEFEIYEWCRSPADDVVLGDIGPKVSFSIKMN